MDINVVRTKINMLESELRNLMMEQELNQAQITITRGRLIRTLRQEYKLEINPIAKDRIMQKIKFQSNIHLEQINHRISNNKKNEQKFLRQISTEFALKIRRLATNMAAIGNSKGFGEAALNSLKVAGNAVSITTSVAKVPIVAALKLGTAVVPIVARIIVQPLHIPGFYFSKFINPDSQYNGKGIDNVGKILEDRLKEVLDLTQSGIRKL